MVGRRLESASLATPGVRWSLFGNNHEGHFRAIVGDAGGCYQTDRPGWRSIRSDRLPLERSVP